MNEFSEHDGDNGIAVPLGASENGINVVLGPKVIGISELLGADDNGMNVELGSELLGADDNGMNVELGSVLLGADENGINVELGSILLGAIDPGSRVVLGTIESGTDVIGTGPPVAGACITGASTGVDVTGAVVSRDRRVCCSRSSTCTPTMSTSAKTAASAFRRGINSSFPSKATNTLALLDVDEKYIATSGTGRSTLPDIFYTTNSTLRTKTPPLFTST